MNDVNSFWPQEVFFWLYTSWNEVICFITSLQVGLDWLKWFHELLIKDLNDGKLEKLRITTHTGTCLDTLEILEKLIIYANVEGKRLRGRSPIRWSDLLKQKSSSRFEEVVRWPQTGTSAGALQTARRGRLVFTISLLFFVSIAQLNLTLTSPPAPVCR